MLPHGITGPQNQKISIGQTPSHAKICGDPTINVRDIRDRKFVLPEKIEQSSQKFFMGYCSPKPLNNPNFVVIG